MNGREYFHESVVRDIVDVLTSLKDYDEVQFINNTKANRSFKSITSATKDLILTFPVMVSSDIEPDNAIMIAKAHEKKMASLLHILFTAISVGNNEDVFDYVKKFHSNMGSMNGTLDSYVDSLDKLATTFGESYDQTLTIDKDVLNTVLEDLKESNYTLPDDVKESSLESYKIVPGYRTGMRDMVIKEVKYDRRNGTVTFDNYADAQANAYSSNPDIADAATAYMMSADQQTAGRNDIRTITHTGGHNDTRTNINVSDREQASEDATLISRYENSPNHGGISDQAYREAIARQNQRNGANRVNDDIGRNRYKAGFENDKQYAEYMKNMAEFHNKAVLNNEYKKANELQPTMMVINFMRHSEESGDSINTAVIGIKAKIYPVSSADICNRISGKLDDKNVLTNFVRATTNEIAFFRDFLFAIDNAKMDAMSYGKKATSNKLWKVLERRSQKSKFRRSLRMYNDATAITTLVLSENDAEYLKKVHNIDILNVSKARKILDAYNFMCICVLNQSTEVASILYDTGDDTYEMIPFSGLEREASDNSYKKMVNLLSKVSR
jgi:hypothetical protein|nr:MAG TPA: hypothetical protein [Caudoviricetes sp.]